MRSQMLKGELEVIEREKLCYIVSTHTQTVDETREETGRVYGNQHLGKQLETEPLPLHSRDLTHGIANPLTNSWLRRAEDLG